MDDGWESVGCAACGRRESTPVVVVPMADAPGGRSAVVQCSGCGLRRLDPRPGGAIIGRYYAAAGGQGYNAYAGRRRSPFKQAVWDALRDGYSRPAGQAWWSRLLSPLTGAVASWAFDINVRLDQAKGLRVLEVGAGFGDLLIYLRQRGCEVLGTDLSGSGAAMAKTSGIEVRLGHLAELKLPTGGFDVAVMCHSLEHVADPGVELAELARLLRPGGRLHIAVPNGRAVRLEHDGTDWIHLSAPLHLWFYDAATLTRLLERHGFRTVVGPRTTTMHHALNAWRFYFFRHGPVAATRRLFRFLRESARRPDGGDILRVVAEKVG